MSDKKSVTKNDHFLKPCHEGQLGPPSVTNRRVFVSLSICFKNFLTRNIVVDVKQISNNSGIKTATTWMKSKHTWWRNNM